MNSREQYDASIADRLGLLAENAMDSVSDALQAMMWAAPRDDDLTSLYMDANRLNNAISSYRASNEHTDR